MSTTSNQTEMPSSPPLMLLQSVKNTETDELETVVSQRNTCPPPTPVASEQIIYIDNTLLQILRCLPYKIPKSIESKALSILSSSWSLVPDEDKKMVTDIFQKIGENKQVTTRLRLVVNEITKDGKIDMDDLPHIADLILLLIDIFDDLKLPPKYDHLIIPVFEFTVFIIISSTLDSAETLESWSNIIKSALRLVKLQLKQARKCSCKCF
jgi:hypothetical protein